MTADALGRLWAIHLRHLHVHQGQVEGLAGNPPDGFCTAVHHHHAVARPLQHAAGHHLVDGVVLHQQDAQVAGSGRIAVPRRPGTVGGLGRRRTGRPGDGVLRGTRQVQHEAEFTAPAGLACQCQLPAHQSHQLVRDAQAQPRAAKLAGDRSIGLREGVENAGLLLDRNAHARVLDRKPDPLRLHRYRQCDTTCRCELDGVAQQIGQHLPQTHIVTMHQRGRVGVPAQVQSQILLVAATAQQLDELVHQRPQIEIDRMQVQPAGFNLRKIQDVVQDHQQGLAGAVGHLQSFLL